MRPWGVLDIDFQDSWKAIGVVISEAPITVIIKDGDKEVARGVADTLIEGRKRAFNVAIPEPQNDCLKGFIEQTGAEIPRRRDWDD